jgi:tungstate transport system substrate-binding protein
MISIAATAVLASLGARAQERAIVVASTTSTQDSGLFGHILPLFKARTGIEVRVVAQGTGQALDTARRGDADVALIHARELEERFVAEGFGVARHDVMYNDFVLAGPIADPASVRGGRDIAAALRAIHARGATFVSRGDRSGTHVAELALWRAAGLDPASGKPAWYREIGQGMGAALNTANAMGAYVLTDRATWGAFRNKEGMAIAVEGDARLFNPYGVILVNPARHPHVKRALGQAFIDWLLSPEGQGAIASFRVGGEQLFFPNASPSPPRRAS